MGTDDSGPAPPRGKPDHAEPAAATPPNTSKTSSRRRRAALRSTPLGPCGCIRDPDHDRHHCGDEITETTVDGYHAAVLHLRALGLLAAPNIPAMRQLWSHGGDDRQLVSEIAQRWELAG